MRQSQLLFSLFAWSFFRWLRWWSSLHLPSVVYGGGSASCCGLPLCLPSSRGRFPRLSYLVCTRPCTSAVGGHGVVCQRQVLHRGCPKVFCHPPCGAHGHSSAFCAVWVVCTWWGDRRGPGPQCWAPCLCSWYWGCGGGFILECVLNHWNESCPYASTSWMKC